MERDVLPAEEMGLEARPCQRRRGVGHRELPVEAVVGEPEHAVVVGIAAGGQARAARAALGRGAESVREHDALCCERVEVRALDAAHPVRVQMAADVMRGHENHVVRRHALCARPAGRHRFYVCFASP